MSGRIGVDPVAAVPLQHAMLLAILLFSLGVVGVLVRRNLLFILMSIEIMLNAAGLAFIVAGARWGQADGQIMFMFVLTLAAAEVAIGLALIIRIRHRLTTLDSDAADLLQG
jgi:NADH-quinone oxidoreductase subunit K